MKRRLSSTHQSSCEIVHRGRHRPRCVGQKTVSGILDAQKRARKPRTAHLVEQSAELRIPPSGQPDDPRRQTKRVGKLAGHGKLEEGSRKFHPVEVTLDAKRSRTSVKNTLRVPTAHQFVPRLPSKPQGPRFIRRTTRLPLFVSLEIAGIDRKQKRAAEPVGSPFHPTQRQASAERIPGQPARFRHLGRHERIRTRREKIRTDPVQTGLRRGPDRSPIAPPADESVQRDDGCLQEAARRSSVSR